MKIPFLLMLVSVFAAFSYMPVGGETRQGSVAARIKTRLMPNR